MASRLRAALKLPRLGSTPTAPASGEDAIYTKSDGKLYLLDSTGVESLVSGGSGGGYPSFASEISVWPSDFTVGTTTPGNVGNSISFYSYGPDDIFLAVFTADVSPPANVVNFMSFNVDGAAWNSDLIRTHAGANTATSTWWTVSRATRLTGLAQGTHTVGLRSWNNTSGTTSVKGVDSTLTVIRIGGSIGGGFSQEYTVNTGTVASAAESGNMTITHNLGVVPSIVVGHLEDGSWSHEFGWRVVSKDASTVVLKMRNNGPNSGSAILRFRLLTPQGYGVTNDSGWITLPYAAGWSAYGSGWQTPQYRRIGNEVKLRGLMVVNTSTGTNPVICTLPVGYRPPATMGAWAWGYLGSGSEIAGKLNINTDGTILFSTATAPAFTSGGYIFLNASFFVD